jgi:hypothetical protein
MDCSATFFVDEFLNFINISVVLLLLGQRIRLSSSADTRLALKREWHSNTAVQLKECSLKTPRAFEGL